MSKPEPKTFRVVLFQEDTDPADELHGEVYRAGEWQLLGMVHGRSQLPISLDAVKAGGVEVGEGVDAEAGRLQVVCFDRARDVPGGVRTALVVLEGIVGEDGPQATARARRLDTTAIYRRMNQGG